MKKFSRSILAVAAVAVAGLFATPAPMYCADLTITAGNVVPGPRASRVHGVAGGSLTAGVMVYYDTATLTYKAADANASATTSQVVGMAANGASSGQYVTIITEDDDLTIGATVSMSAPVYVLSATAGGIAPSADIAAGWYPAVVAVAKSTTKVIFNARGLRGTAVAVAP